MEDRKKKEGSKRAPRGGQPGPARMQSVPGPGAAVPGLSWAEPSPRSSRGCLKAPGRVPLSPSPPSGAHRGLRAAVGSPGAAAGINGARPAPPGARTWALLMRAAPLRRPGSDSCGRRQGSAARPRCHVSLGMNEGKAVSISRPSSTSFSQRFFFSFPRR